MSTLRILILFVAILLHGQCHIHKRKPIAGNPVSDVFPNNVTSRGDDRREFIWFSNKAGIFSQFIQLKIMHYLMEKSRRILTIAPSYSPHYGDIPINLCEIFVLPSYINCPRAIKLEPEMQCITHTISLDQIASDKTKICYQGPLPRLGARTPREAILRGVDVPLPLIFQSNHTILLEQFKRAIGIHETGNSPFTVVHWRRGDQLTTRCQQKKDVSINCGAAEDLVALIQGRTNHSLVYIATNEVPGSSEMAVLRDAGFKVFADAMMGNVDVIETFIIEASLMRDADLFLAWGVSEVNDVIEVERRNAGKFWCSTVEEMFASSDSVSAAGAAQSSNGTSSPDVGGVAPGDSKGDPTWCAQQLLAQKTNGTSSRFGLIPGRKQSSSEGSGINSNATLTAREGGKLVTTGSASSSVWGKFEASFNFSAELASMLRWGGMGDRTRLKKTVRTKSKRVLAVVGIEGSGLDIVDRLLHACFLVGNVSLSGDAGVPSLCERDLTLASLLLEARPRGKSSGLFTLGDLDATATVRVVNSIEGLLRKLNYTFSTERARGHLAVIGLGANSPSIGSISTSSSVLTYPVGLLDHLGASIYPDIFLLALLCERAGLDLRIIVMQRPAREIVARIRQAIASKGPQSAGGVWGSSSSSHENPSPNAFARDSAPESSAWQQAIVDGADILSSQLSLLDPAFIHCVDSRDLSAILGSSSGRWGATREVYKDLVDFAHPTLFPEAVKKSRVVGPMGSNSSDSSVELGGEEGFNSQVAASSASLHLFKLEARVRVLGSLCAPAAAAPAASTATSNTRRVARHR